MKKLILCGSLFLLGVACSNYEELPTPDVPAAVTVEADQSAEPYRVTVDEALAHADRALSRGDKTRSLARRVKSYDYYVAKPATRSLGDTIEVAFHLINYEDNGGFAMIAADERATPVYAYSDSGQLLPEDFVNNPGLAIYEQIAIEGYQAEIASYTPTDFEPIPIIPYYPAPGVLVTLPDGTCYIESVINDYSKRVSPLLNTKWSQGYPYNYLCGGEVAGCGPIAIAQIFTYHRHPISYNGYVFDWENMQRSFNGSEMIGVPMFYDIAKLVSFIFDVADTGDPIEGLTWPWKMVDIVRSFGYHSTHRQTFNPNAVLENLNDNHPLLMFGAKSEIYLPEAHYWVVDGYDLLHKEVGHHYPEPPYEMYGRSTKYSLKYHINWGWGGSQDGFYYLPNGVDYNHHVDVIYEIYPEL